jgi:hypothetical protein
MEPGPSIQALIACAAGGFVIGYMIGFAIAGMIQ